MKYYILIIFLLFGCSETSKKVNRAKSIKSDSHSIWIVDSLKIPICELCDQARLKTNILFSDEVEVGNKIILNGAKLIHVSKAKDTLSINNFRLDSNSFEIFGSDWIDDASIISLNGDRLVLSKTQNVISDIEAQNFDNTLIIYLNKEK